MPGFCRGIACLCTIACVNSLGSIVLMSFSRYVSICHHNLYNTIKKNRLLNDVFLSLFDRSIVNSPEFCWNRRSFVQSSEFGVYLGSIDYLLLHSILHSDFCLETVTCHRDILRHNFFLKFRGSKRIVNATSHAQQKRPLYLAKTLFLIYTAFVLCWIPYAILMVADREDSFPLEIHVIITTFANLHPSFN